MTHDQHCEQLEEYILGTLDEPAYRELDAHLAECLSCRDRVAELARVSVMIAERIESTTPPVRIRAALLKRALDDSASRGTTLAAGSSSRWPVFLALAATLVLIISHGWFWLERRQLRAELQLLQTEREKQQAELARYEDATLLLGKPGMEFVDLNGVDPNPQAFGKVVVDPVRGNGVVYMYKLPPTPEGKAYKMWVLREGKPTSAGEFTVASDGSAVLKLDKITDLQSIAAFQVTIEDIGRAQLPTGMMYLTGPLLPSTN